MKSWLKLTSIENVSLIRKFTVLFVFMSLLPFAIITYLFVQFRSYGTIDIKENTLFVLLFLSGLGGLAGFYGMRKSIVKINEIARQVSAAVLKDPPATTMAVAAAVGSTKERSEESEIAQLTRTFHEITSNLEDNIRQLEESKRTMQYVLSKLAVGIASPHSIDTFLDLIVEITANALGAKAGVLMLLDEDRQELYVKNTSSFSEKFKNVRIAVGDAGPGWVAKHKKPLLVPALDKATASSEDNPFTPPLLCAPMLCQDKLIGVLAVVGKSNAENFKEDELLIMSNLASQTAIAVENEWLNQDAEKAYLETISALAMAVEARDLYSRGHSDNVANYSVRLAEKLGLQPQAVKDIKDSAELHDVGKIGISDAILRKPGRLTEEEMRIMRQHPVIGEGIVKPVRSLSRLCSIIRHHHEFIDGTGYPDGLKGEQIPIGAKILAVTDSFDAMTTDRPYRKALSIEEAKEELKKYIDIHYDRKVVEAFMAIV